MADVARPAGMLEQVGLLAALRWRMFRNSLFTTRGKLDFVARLLLGGLAGLWALGTGIGLGLGAYFLTARGQFVFLPLLFWAVFLLWQVVPLMVAASHASFDFQNLLRFPVRFSVFFLLSLAYGLSDPPVVAAVVWLIAIAAGTVLAQPDLLGVALVVAAVFAAMNLLLSRMVLALLERWLARRRTREVLVAVFLLVFVTGQLMAALGESRHKSIAPYVKAVLPALQYLLPGLAGRALAGAADDNLATVFSSIAALMAYALAFGLLFSRRLRAQYRGEDLGETPAALPVYPVRREALPAGAAARAARRIPGLDAPVAAVFEKELRYALRNTNTLLLMALPIILVAFFVLIWSGSRREPGPFERWPDAAFPGAVAYMFLIVSQVALNSFAFEGRGIQLLFVAPIRFRDVLLGKNLLLALLLIVESTLVWLIIALGVRPPGALIVLTTFAGLLFATVMQSLAGNWLSIRFPRRMEFGVARRRASGVTALVGIGLQLALFAVAAGAYALGRLLGWAWLAPLVLLGLSAAALRVYIASLDYLARLAAEKRETLTAELAR